MSKAVCWLFAALSLPVAIPAMAQERLDHAVLVEVKPGPKRYFHADISDKSGCPAAGTACRRRAFVVAGDLLVGGETRGGFTYATYTAPDGRTTEGWVETAAIRRIDPPAANVDSWLGAWAVNAVSRDASLTITRGAATDMVHLEGGAEEGINDRWRVDHGAIHIGLVAAEATVQDGRLSFSTGAPDERGATPVTSRDGFEMGTLAYDAPGRGDGSFGDDRCRIRMRLMAPYLLVADNTRCGAANVSFTGVYRRQ